MLTASNANMGQETQINGRGSEKQASANTNSGINVHIIFPGKCRGSRMKIQAVLWEDKLPANALTLLNDAIEINNIEIYSASKSSHVFKLYQPAVNEEERVKTASNGYLLLGKDQSDSDRLFVLSQKNDLFLVGAVFEEFLEKHQQDSYKLRQNIAFNVIGSPPPPQVLIILHLFRHNCIRKMTKT